MLACMNCDEGSVFRDPLALAFYVYGTLRIAVTHAFSVAQSCVFESVLLYCMVRCCWSTVPDSCLKLG